MGEDLKRPIPSVVTVCHSGTGALSVHLDRMGAIVAAMKPEGDLDSWFMDYTRSDLFTALRDAAEAVVEAHDAGNEQARKVGFDPSRFSPGETGTAIERLKQVLSELPKRGDS